MKIAFVTKDRLPGSHSSAHEIMRSCAAIPHSGHEVTLFHGGIDESFHMSPFRYEGIQADFAIEPLQTGRFRKKPPEEALRSIASDIDVWMTREFLYLPSLLKLKPVIFEVDTIPRIRRSRFVALCNKCILVVALSSMQKQQLIDLGVVATIVVAPLAVQSSRFKRLPSKTKTQHHFRIPEDRLALLFLGPATTHGKIHAGIDVYVDAVLRVRTTCSVFSWFIDADESTAHSLRKILVTKGLTDHDFRIDGHIAPRDIHEVYAASDACVYSVPKKYESFSYAPHEVLEAAVCRPIVCADIPPIKELFKKQHVRFVHPGSESSLSAGIVEICESYADATSRVSKAKDALASHTWEHRMKLILGSCCLKD